MAKFKKLTVTTGTTETASDGNIVVDGNIKAGYANISSSSDTQSLIVETTGGSSCYQTFGDGGYGNYSSVGYHNDCGTFLKNEAGEYFINIGNDEILYFNNTYPFFTVPYGIESVIVANDYIPYQSNQSCGGNNTNGWQLFSKGAEIYYGSAFSNNNPLRCYLHMAPGAQRDIIICNEDDGGTWKLTFEDWHESSSPAAHANYVADPSLFEQNINGTITFIQPLDGYGAWYIFHVKFDGNMYMIDYIGSKRLASFNA